MNCDFNLFIGSKFIFRKVNKMNTISTTLFAAGTAFVLSTSAALAHSQIENTEHLPAVAGNGGTHAISASCHSGHVTGGGFMMTETSTSHWPFEVSKSYATGNQTWTIELTNKSGVVTHSRPGYKATVFAMCTGGH